MSSYRDFRTILGFDPRQRNRCVGVSQKNPTCNIVINYDDCREANYLLDQMDRSTSIPEFSDLQELAGLMLCKKYHNSRSTPHLNQIDAVSLKWNALIKKELDIAMKRKERKEREAKKKSSQELERMFAPNFVKMPTIKAVVRKPTFEVFRDEPTVALSNFTTTRKENVPMLKDQPDQKQLARRQAKSSSTMISDSVFPPTPDATPSPRRDMYPARSRNELPSTPTRPAKPSKQEPNLATVNTPHARLPLTPESLFSFGDNSRQVTPGFDFRFTPPPALERSQPLTPPSSLKSENIFGPLLASQEQPQSFKPDSTIHQRPGRIPLGSKSTSTHNTGSLKGPDSPTGIMTKDNTPHLEFSGPMPLQPFIQVPLAEIHESGDFVLESHTQKEMKVEIEEDGQKRILEDSPTIPSGLPTPSQTMQTWQHSKQEHHANLHEKSAVIIDPIEENSAPHVDLDNDLLSKNESAPNHEDKENQEPATDTVLSPLSVEEPVGHEPDLKARPPITADAAEEGFGYVTIISTTTASYRTCIPKQKSPWDSSSNRKSVADLQNRSVTYDFGPVIAQKPLPAIPAPAPVPIVQSKLKERVQICEACGGVEMREANICHCINEIKPTEVPIQSGCFSGLGLRRLKDKVVKKLKKRAERQ